MSNASLKDQLQAVAAQLSETLIKTQTSTKPKKLETAKKTAKTKKPTVSTVNKVDKTISMQKPKPKWLIYVQYGVELLKTYFPQTFKSGSDVQPLKKGIKQDMIKSLSAFDHIATDDKACMVKSLAYYVNTMSYHKCVVEGVIRIDLEGQPAGTVSAEEAKYSSERFQAKISARQAKLTSGKPLIPAAEVEAI